MNVEFIVTIVIVTGLMTLMDYIAFRKWHKSRDILKRIEFLEIGQSLFNDSLCELEDRFDVLEEEVF